MTDLQLDIDPRLAARPPSIARMFLDRVAASPDREAFRYRNGDSWASLTWSQTQARVEALAAGLLSLGVAAEDRVAIASSTRLEWLLADLAVMCSGGATTTIYPSTTHEDVAFMLSDSGSRVAFAEDATQVAKIVSVLDRAPDLRTIVLLDETAPSDFDEAVAARVIPLRRLEALGRELLASDPDAVQRAVAAIGPDDLATLMYTSGTTGQPKGVRLAQDCWVYEGVAIDTLGILRPDDLQYLWLPLSHAFGKVLEAAQLAIGFATAVDGNLDRLVPGLGEVRPTFMAGAPRIFEKVYGRVVTMTEAEGGAKKKIFDWAFRVGRQVSTLQQAGRDVPRALAMQHAVADRLVFAKIRRRFGGRIRYFVSGSAALSREVAEWFHIVGILILEGYGLTETSAFSFVNRPERWRFGTVGLPAPGTEVRIAGDGEVLVRGPGVMRGYHGLPDSTAETLTPDGWLHTGDIGELDDGMLRITDRKKDLIKTSGGKYVAPQGIEGLFKAICPYASQMLVHGDQRNYVVALVTLDEDAILGWARQHGVPGGTYAEVVGSPQARELVQSYVDELNSRLNRWETVKRFDLLDRDLSVEEGDLTPSLKVRRKVVERKYRDRFDALYAA